jgi:Ca-activated chloride channel family protein
MKASYTFSQSLIAANTPADVELLVSFLVPPTSPQPPRRPLNLSLVLDRSGSMAGQPLRAAIEAAQNLVEDLTPDDLLSVVIYDDVAETILPTQSVSDRSSIQKQIGKIQARGCTNLSAGWMMGCALAAANYSANKLNRVLLLTDGLANAGIIEPQVLIKTAREKAEQGIVTTTLGFGTYFNEDLLIDIANAGGGNFYFIQSPDEAADVFRIEMESLMSVVAQNLTVTLQPEGGVQITEILNNYRAQKIGNNLEVFLGDVYGVENKPLALSLSIPPQAKLGTTQVLTLSYQYQTVIDGSIQPVSDRLPVTITVGETEEAERVQPDFQVIEQTSQLRIAQVKDEAIALADRGDYQQASEKLRQMAEQLKQKALQELFEIAEEISQLEYYAQRLDNQRFDRAIRKEMRDQSYQTKMREREDLKFRGITAGAADSLEAVENPEGGILVKCEKISGKLRIRVISDGYDPNLNVQFPRSIREQGVTYVVEKVTLAANGTFYRVEGEIKRLGKPRSAAASFKPKNLKAADSSLTLADLETTTSLGDGVLIQCVQDGKKLRARVVSDGYDPNYNVRFPRNIRQEGVLFVVDEVKETAQGGSYIALGKVKRLIQ